MNHCLRVSLLFSFIAIVSAPAWALDLTKLTSPRTYEQSKASHSERVKLVAEYYVSIGEFNLPSSDDKSVRFGQTALAAILAKDPIALKKISHEIAHTDFNPPLTGTKIKIPVLGCERDGDYDFLLQYFVAIAMLDQQSGERLLSDEARQSLESKFLYVVGGKATSLRFHFPDCRFLGKIKDTENHVLMTEAARFLTNQWRFKRSGEEKFDNSKNGLELWLSQHLREFLLLDFDEYNSKPYESYAIIPIQLLASFSDSPSVKILASSILDHLSAKFSALSLNSQRHLPFRRQDIHKNNKDLFLKDPQTSRHSALIGHLTFLKSEEGLAWTKSGRHLDALWGSLPGYFPARPIVENLLNEEEHKGIQFFSHYNTEIAYKSKNFLISAGGYFKKWWGWFTPQNHGWARPASIITKKVSSSVDKLIHFKGDANEKKRANLCVATNFICGINPFVPSDLPSKIFEKNGNWTFIHHKEGFYVALWRSSSKKTKFGLAEVRDEGELSFEEFKRRVLISNQSDFTLNGSQLFVKSNGERVEFIFKTKRRDHYNIISLNDVRTQIDTKKWSLASGDFYQVNKKDELIYKSNRSLVTIRFSKGKLPSRKTEIFE